MYALCSNNSHWSSFDMMSCLNSWSPMYDAMMTMGLEKLVKRTCNNNNERSRPVKMHTTWRHELRWEEQKIGKINSLLSYYYQLFCNYKWFTRRNGLIYQKHSETITIVTISIIKLEEYSTCATQTYDFKNSLYFPKMNRLCSELYQVSNSHQSMFST